MCGVDLHNSDINRYSSTRHSKGWIKKMFMMYVDEIKVMAWRFYTFTTTSTLQTLRLTQSEFMQALHYELMSVIVEAMQKQMNEKSIQPGIFLIFYFFLIFAN